MGTENIILLVLVVVVVAIGLWSTVRHFRGKGGGCCGGGDYKPRKKKLSHVAGQRPSRWRACTASTAKSGSKKPPTTSKARPARLT
ncbi:MAG: hypothetical protein ACLSCQ_02115 [Evtepia gabavorous]